MAKNEPFLTRRENPEQALRKGRIQIEYGPFFTEINSYLSERYCFTH